VSRRAEASSPAVRVCSSLSISGAVGSGLEPLALGVLLLVTSREDGDRRTSYRPTPAPPRSSAWHARTSSHSPRGRRERRE